MSELDDRPLVRVPEPADPADPAEPVSAPPPRGPNTALWIIAALGLVLGAAGAWWWATGRATPPESAALSAPAPEPQMAEPAEPGRALPPLNQMDPFLRALLGALSASPELARWLATDDLIRQTAHIIDRVSRGLSPAPDLAVVRPAGRFEVAGSGNRLTASRPSYDRYDGLATAVSSLDARAVADAYHTIQPRLNEAYRGLGRSEGHVNDAVVIALQNLIDTPTVQSPIRLVPGPGASWEFADPELRQLMPVQKQLLRMGPDNLARVQVRLREIKRAIDALPQE
jgi:hypothetical protein